ncbi:hypothetical protein C8F04DRAFT_1272973 [Mycena alexandri]|uniref:DUF1479-domain-containing protein n=1 Tax=Mycena alexandri TaxID=1745969 RepID=A0AAD6WPE0_9AGAR|nr:hypothetical protein C8F04DRAFT_1272973 [Mycena alexandri]
MSSPALHSGPRRPADISAAFSSLSSPNQKYVFPHSFAQLKRKIWKDGLLQSWKEVLEELEVTAVRIAERGDSMIPRVTMESIRNGLSAEELSNIRTAGCVVVKGVLPKEALLTWKQDIRDYVAAHPGQVKGARFPSLISNLITYTEHRAGFPTGNVQVFELYNTVSQIRARTHPNVLETHRALLALWHDRSGDVSLDTPISYFDRLRIRIPGDSKFALGPHVDGGSVERWEDPEYRSCFNKILEGGSAWKEYDAYDAAPRAHAKQDLHEASSQCSIFRPWQGWTAMSSTGPGEGTLRVFPSLSIATAYWMLRPFFKPRDPSSTSLKWEDWNELDLDGPAFAGTGLGVGQEFSDATHPHLRLAQTMVSMPHVEPGDQVYWHCDMIHAVEGYHGGKGDASVMYIPAVPLTLENAQYLRDQRNNFLAGLPAPDFPAGPGESTFVGRATAEDVYPGGLGAMGLEKFGVEGNESKLFAEANRILAVA